MEDLIKALQIFLNHEYPTHCVHDELMIASIPLEVVSTEDVIELDKLGFHWSKGNECWISFRFGSC